jgi:hypothetical protein
LRHFPPHPVHIPFEDVRSTGRADHDRPAIGRHASPKTRNATARSQDTNIIPVLGIWSVCASFEDA